MVLSPRTVTFLVWILVSEAALIGAAVGLTVGAVLAVTPSNWLSRDTSPDAARYRLVRTIAFSLVCQPKLRATSVALRLAASRLAQGAPFDVERGELRGESNGAEAGI